MESDFGLTSWLEFSLLVFHTVHLSHNSPVSPFAAKEDVYSWDDVQGADVTIEGNINMAYSLGYAGEYGAYSVIK